MHPPINHPWPQPSHLQVHLWHDKGKPEVRIYSRNQEDNTSKYPDVIQRLRDILLAPGTALPLIDSMMMMMMIRGGVASGVGGGGQRGGGLGPGQQGHPPLPGPLHKEAQGRCVFGDQGSTLSLRLCC